MTEEQIERCAEAMMDALDRAYLGTDMSEPEYMRRVREIDDWTRQQARGTR